MVVNIHDPFTDLLNTLISRVNYLHNAGAMIQTQPNGFLRLALNNQKNSENGLFLHAWHPNLPTQRFLHTHVFDMTSRIITGSLQDIMYKVTPQNNGPFQLVKSRCTQNDCTIIETLTHAHLKESRILNLNHGEIYSVSKGQFHMTTITSKTKTALTLMEKYNTENTPPILAIPSHTPIPKAPFYRNIIEQDYAWNIIKSLLKSALEGESL